MSLTEKIKNVFAKKAAFEYEIAVEGMKCEHCSARLVAVLSARWDITLIVATYSNAVAQFLELK